jgi:dTDP-glucose 4,6-dehydratase
MRILITGGAGFIGSHFTKLIIQNHPDHQVTVLDALTYCGNLENLEEVQDNPNYTFIQGDIRDCELVEKVMKETDRVIHFAAETHVDRSIPSTIRILSSVRI